MSPSSTLTQVTVWYLEMRQPSELCPRLLKDPKVQIIRAEIPSPELSRFLYTGVGGDWYWRDRLVWSYDQWMAYLNRPAVQTWVAYEAGTPAGYVELEAQQDGSVKIAYFGLMRQFFGRGIGGYLLTRGIQQAWEMQANRVWVHTCTLDGPYALKNYQARGFRIYKTETFPFDLSQSPPGPWQNAYTSDQQP